MADKLRWRIFGLCFLSMFVALATTIASLCIYRHYQERLKDKAILDDYMAAVFSDENETELSAYQDCFLVKVDPDGVMHMCHNQLERDYSLDYLMNVSRRILQQREENGQQSGFLFQIAEQTDARYILCRSLEHSYREVSITFGYSFGPGMLLILLTVLFLRFWVNRIIEPIVQANHAQIQFFSDVGHELKTPLAIISANTEVLELSGGENQWTKTILKQVERTNELVSDMLMLTRLENRDTMMKKEYYPLGIRLMEELETFQVMADMKGISYDLAIDEEISIEASPALMDQAIIELLNNAMKYTPGDGILSVSLKEKNDQVLLQMENSYEALSKEELKQIFERFYRRDQSRSRETGGFGIGLAAVKSIVERHQGSIRATNGEIGLCFVITLPVSENNEIFL